MQSKAKTVEEYINEQDDQTKETLAQLRKIILENIDKNYQEVMLWGMICYIIPLERYPYTYNKQPLMYTALAAQKNHLSLYLTNIYMDERLGEWFEQKLKESGKKLSMGKSCIRFKKIEDLPIDLIEKTLAKTSLKQYLALYENVHPNN